MIDMLDSVANFAQFPFRLHAVQGKLAIATLVVAIVIMVKVRTRYFYYTDCPLKEECSKAAWERAKKCVATEPQKARDLLVDHLQKSGKHWSHKFSDDDAVALAEAESLQFHDTDVEEEEEETATPRPSSIDGKRRRLALQDTGVTASSSTSMTVGDADTLVTKAIVAIERAAEAARHAERLSLSAAAAFHTEARTLEEALATMRRLNR